MNRRQVLLLPAVGALPLMAKQTAPRYVYMFHNLNSFLDPSDQMLAVEAYKGMERVTKRHNLEVQPFFTGLSFEMYLKNAPELMDELKRSKRDYHHHGANRPPRPQLIDRVGTKPWKEALRVVADYEKYAIDARSGKLDPTQEGGLKKMISYFGRPPLATGRFVRAPIMAATKDVYGAKMGVGTHDWFGVPSSWIWYMGTLNRPDDAFVHPNWDFADWVRVEWAKKKGDDIKAVRRARPNEPWDIRERMRPRLQQLDAETPAFVCFGFHNNDLFGFNTDTKIRYEPAYREFFLEKMDEFLGWLIQETKGKPTTLRQAYTMASANNVRPVAKDARVLAQQVVDAVEKDKALPLYVRAEKSGHSLVETWQLLKAALSGAKPDIRDLYGPTEVASKSAEAWEASAVDVRAATKTLPQDEIPAKVSVAGKECNAAEFLYLMSKAACGVSKATIVPITMMPPVEPREKRFEDPLSLLQMWTLKPVYYGKLGGRLQLATSVEVNLQTGRMERSKEMLLLRPQDRPPY